MRTRTLLLLAVVCGLAILLAGGIQLLRVSGDGESTADLSVGDTALAGDLTVTVVDAAEADGLIRVQVRVAGVDDPDGIDGFRLVVNGGLLTPLSADQAGAGGCGNLTVAAQTCDLVFGIAQVEGTARVLLVRRGEDQHRWVLA